MAQEMLLAQHAAIRRLTLGNGASWDYDGKVACLLSTLLLDRGKVVALPSAGPLAPRVSVTGLPEGFNEADARYQAVLTKMRMDMAELGRPETQGEYAPNGAGGYTILVRHVYDPETDTIVIWAMSVKALEHA